MTEPAKRAARLAVLTALGVLLLFLTSVVPSAHLALIAVASFPVCAALMMYGYGWAAGVFAVTAVLGFLLFPGTAALGYALFFGWYPIAKSLLERLRSKTAGYALKLVLYACAFAAYWFLARALFSGLDGVLPWYWLLIIGAAVFAVYDWCYSLLIRFYIEKIARYIS